MVEKAVHERTRLTKIYVKRKEELEKQHQEVRQQLEQERARVIVLHIFLYLYYLLFLCSGCELVPITNSFIVARY